MGVTSVGEEPLNPNLHLKSKGTDPDGGVHACKSRKPKTVISEPAFNLGFELNSLPPGSF